MGRSTDFQSVLQRFFTQNAHASSPRWTREGIGAARHGTDPFICGADSLVLGLACGRNLAEINWVASGAGPIHRKYRRQLNIERLVQPTCKIKRSQARNSLHVQEKVRKDRHSLPYLAQYVFAV
jgi:hypothetical protein